MEEMKSFGNSNVEITPFGIDLGTTNSGISIGQQSGRSLICRLPNDKTSMPSTIRLIGNEEGSVWDDIASREDSDVVEYKGNYYLVGQRVYDNEITPAVARSAKRHMQDNDVFRFMLEYDGLTVNLEPYEIGAIVLKGLISQIKDQYGDVKQATVTVPAYFNNKGINNTIKAADGAGFKCINILREPTAAALCYNLDLTTSEEDEYSLVYDLGGGTFDITLIRISQPADITRILSAYGIDPSEFQDKSTGKMVEAIDLAGDGVLGGDDYDNNLKDIALVKILGVLDKMFIDPKTIELKEDGDKLIGYDKSSGEKIGIKNVDFVTRRYTKDDFTELSIYNLTHRLSKAKESPNVEENVIQYKRVMETKDGEHLTVKFDMNPADFETAFLPIYKRTKILTDQVLERNKDIKISSIILMGGSTKNPILRKKLKSDYSTYDVFTGLDPDESVALGAGIKSRSYLYGDNSIQIFDALPQSIGILDNGTNKVDFLLKKNWQLPSSAHVDYKFLQDNQKAVVLSLYQGEDIDPSRCVKLGDITIDDLKEMTADKSVFTIKLAVNVDSILTCYANVGGKEKEVKINLNSIEKPKELSKQEQRLARLKKAALELGESDRIEIFAMIDDYPNTSWAKIMKRFNEIKNGSK